MFDPFLTGLWIRGNDGIIKASRKESRKESRTCKRQLKDLFVVVVVFLNCRICLGRNTARVEAGSGSGCRQDLQCECASAFWTIPAKKRPSLPSLIAPSSSNPSLPAEDPLPSDPLPPVRLPLLRPPAPQVKHQPPPPPSSPHPDYCQLPIEMEADGSGLFHIDSIDMKLAVLETRNDYLIRIS